MLSLPTKTHQIVKSIRFLKRKKRILFFFLKKHIDFTIWCVFASRAYILGTGGIVKWIRLLYDGVFFHWQAWHFGHRRNRKVKIAACQHGLLFLPEILFSYIGLLFSTQPEASCRGENGTAPRRAFGRRVWRRRLEMLGRKINEATWISNRQGTR